MKFIQDGDLFMLDTPVQDYSTGTPGASALTCTLASVPLGVRVQAQINVGIVNTVGGEAVYVSDLSLADLVASATVAPGQTVRTHVAGTYGYTNVAIMTSTAQAIRARCVVGDANTTFKINTLGWVDSRGRNA